MESDNNDAGRQPSLDTIFKRIHLASLELAQVRTLNELYRRAVELGRKCLDIDRMGILLYNPETSIRQGTWGTDEHGNTCDESMYRCSIRADENHLMQSLTAHDDVAVWENKTLTNWNRAVGTGWNAMAMLWNGDQAFGWIAADNLLRQKPFEPGQKEGMGLYARIVSNLVLRLRYEQDLESEVLKKTEELNRDKERLQKLYDEIVAQDESKKQLFTIFAHDIRGPLGSIRTLLDLVCDDLDSASEDDIKAFLPEIRKSVSASYSLAENLLDWVRNQMVKSEPNDSPFPALHPVRSTMELCERQAERKSIRLSVDGEQDLMVNTDEYMLEIIIRNLLSNAIKFTPQGGSIRLTVKASREESATLIRIVDSGIGMDEETLAGLFSLQSNVKTEGTLGEKGSGLGLVFCHDIATKIGARIDVKSQVGVGSEFTIVLPSLA